MSGVIVVDDLLRARVMKELSQMAREYPRSSLAAEVLPAYFDAVVDGVSQVIDLDASDDFEISLIVALQKWRSRNAAHFVRQKKNPFSLSIWKK